MSQSGLINLTKKKRSDLEAMVGKSPAAVSVERGARVVLLSADGVGGAAIAT